jgi:hypothetical protein
MLGVLSCQVFTKVKICVYIYINTPYIIEKNI